MKLFIQKLYNYILYTNNPQKLRKLDYTPGSGQAVTALHISPHRMSCFTGFNS
jgi:hypothetical protein